LFQSYVKIQIGSYFLVLLFIFQIKRNAPQPCPWKSHLYVTTWHVCNY